MVVVEEEDIVEEVVDSKGGRIQLEEMEKLTLTAMLRPGRLTNAKLLATVAITSSSLWW